MRLTSPRRPGITLVFAAALLGFAAVAFGVMRWWLSGAAALVVAALLWRQHPRARFAAYVYFSALALRAVWRHEWVLLAFAAGAVALLQLRAARRAWPRLRPGKIRAGSDRMPGP